MNPDNMNFTDQSGAWQPSRMHLLSQMQAALERQNESSNAASLLGQQAGLPSFGHLNPSNPLGLSALQRRLALEEESRLRSSAQAQIDRLSVSGSDPRRQQYLDIGLANQFHPGRIPTGTMGRDFLSPQPKRRRVLSTDFSSGVKLPARGRQLSWAKTGPAAQKMPMPRRQSARRVTSPSLGSYRKAWNSMSMRARRLASRPSPKERLALVNEVFSRSIQFGTVGLYTE